MRLWTLAVTLLAFACGAVPDETVEAELDYRGPETQCAPGSQWVIQGSPTVCGFTPFNRAEKVCSTLKSRLRAHRMCWRFGARLCSQDEILAKEVADPGAKGCGLDSNMIWTNTLCPGTRRRKAVVVRGDGMRRRCRHRKNGLAFVRCCLDIEPASNVTFQALVDVGVNKASILSTLDSKLKSLMPTASAEKVLLEREGQVVTLRLAFASGSVKMNEFFQAIASPALPTGWVAGSLILAPCYSGNTGGNDERCDILRNCLLGPDPGASESCFQKFDVCLCDSRLGLGQPSCSDEDPAVLSIPVFQTQETSNQLSVSFEQNGDTVVATVGFTFVDLLEVACDDNSPFLASCKADSQCHSEEMTFTKTPTEDVEIFMQSFRAPQTLKSLSVGLTASSGVVLERELPPFDDDLLDIVPRSSPSFSVVTSLDDSTVTGEGSFAVEECRRVSRRSVNRADPSKGQLGSVKAGKTLDGVSRAEFHAPSISFTEPISEPRCNQFLANVTTTLTEEVPSASPTTISSVAQGKLETVSLPESDSLVNKGTLDLIVEHENIGQSRSANLRFTSYADVSSTPVSVSLSSAQPLQVACSGQWDSYRNRRQASRKRAASLYDGTYLTRDGELQVASSPDQRSCTLTVPDGHLLELAENLVDVKAHVDMSTDNTVTSVRGYSSYTSFFRIDDFLFADHEAVQNHGISATVSPSNGSTIVQLPVFTQTTYSQVDLDLYENEVADHSLSANASYEVTSLSGGRNLATFLADGALLVSKQANSISNSLRIPTSEVAYHEGKAIRVSAAVGLSAFYNPSSLSSTQVGPLADLSEQKSVQAGTSYTYPAADSSSWGEQAHLSVQFDVGDTASYDTVITSYYHDGAEDIQVFGSFETNSLQDRRLLVSRRELSKKKKKNKAKGKSKHKATGSPSPNFRRLVQEDSTSTSSASASPGFVRLSETEDGEGTALFTLDTRIPVSSVLQGDDPDVLDIELEIETELDVFEEDPDADTRRLLKRRRGRKRNGNSGKKNKAKGKSKHKAGGVPSPSFRRRLFVEGSQTPSPSPQPHATVSVGSAGDPDGVSFQINLHGGSSNISSELVIGTSTYDDELDEEVIKGQGETTFSVSSPNAGPPDRTKNLADGSYTMFRTGQSPGSMSSETKIPSNDNDGIDVSDPDVQVSSENTLALTNVAEGLYSSVTTVSNYTTTGASMLSLARRRSLSLLSVAQVQDSADFSAQVDSDLTFSSLLDLGAEGNGVKVQAAIQRKELECVTDGGYESQGTACVFDEVTPDCVRFTEAQPYIARREPDLPTLDTTDSSSWCPTVSRYSIGSRTKRAKWGYCNCVHPEERERRRRRRLSTGTDTVSKTVSVSSSFNFVSRRRLSEIHSPSELHATQFLTDLSSSAGGSFTLFGSHQDDSIGVSLELPEVSVGSLVDEPVEAGFELDVCDTSIESTCLPSAIKKLRTTIQTVLSGVAAQQRVAKLRSNPLSSGTRLGTLQSVSNKGIAVQLTEDIEVKVPIPASGSTSSVTSSLGTGELSTAQVRAGITQGSGSEKSGTINIVAGTSGGDTNVSFSFDRVDPAFARDVSTKAGSTEFSLQTEFDGAGKVIQGQATIKKSSSSGVDQGSGVDFNISPSGKVSLDLDIDDSGETLDLELGGSSQEEGAPFPTVFGFKTSIQLSSDGGSSGSRESASFAFGLDGTITLQIPVKGGSLANITFESEDPVNGKQSASLLAKGDSDGTNADVFLVVTKEPGKDPVVEKVSRPTPQPTSSPTPLGGETSSPTPAPIPGPLPGATCETDCRLCEDENSCGSFTSPTACWWAEGKCHLKSDACHFKDCKACDTEASCLRSIAGPKGCRLLDVEEPDPYSDAEYTFYVDSGSNSERSPGSSDRSYSPSFQDEYGDSLIPKTSLSICTWVELPKSTLPQLCRDNRQNFRSSLCQTNTDSCTTVITACPAEGGGRLRHGRVTQGEPIPIPIPTIGRPFCKQSKWFFCPYDCPVQCSQGSPCEDVSSSFCSNVLKYGCENADPNGINVGVTCPKSCPAFCGECMDRDRNCYDLVFEKFLCDGVWGCTSSTFNLLGETIFPSSDPCNDGSRLSNGMLVSKVCPYSCGLVKKSTCKTNPRPPPEMRLKPPCKAKNSPAGLGARNFKQCVFPFTVGGKTYDSCVDYSVLKPYNPDVSKYPNSGLVCPTVEAYSSRNRDTRTQWGYCSCPTSVDLSDGPPPLQVCPDVPFKIQLHNQGLKDHVIFPENCNSAGCSVGIVNMFEKYAESMLTVHPYPSEGPCAYFITSKVYCTDCPRPSSSTSGLLPPEFYGGNSIDVFLAFTETGQAIFKPINLTAGIKPPLWRVTQPISHYKGNSDLLQGGDLHIPYISLRYISLDIPDLLLDAGFLAATVEESERSVGWHIFSEFDLTAFKPTFLSKMVVGSTWRPLNPTKLWLLRNVLRTELAPSISSTFCSATFLNTGDLCRCGGVTCTELNMVTKLNFAGVKLTVEALEYLEPLPFFGVELIDLSRVTLTSQPECWNLPSCTIDIATCILPAGEEFC